LKWGVKAALENHGRKWAAFYFSRLLDSPFSRHFSRCDYCKSYFAYERARFRTVKHGVFCPNCDRKGSAVRTKDSREQIRSKWYDTAAGAWIAWKPSHRNGDQREWVAKQVKKAHRLEIGRRWVSQHLTEILERVEALRNAKG
jgi:hypothetical protein